MKKLFLLPMLFIALTINAQKIVTEKGNLSDLKGEKTFKLVYNYDNLSVGQYSTEQAYIDYKKSEYAKKDPAKAESWYEGWKSAREKYYQPKFEEQINKYNKKVTTVLPSNLDAKYTLMVKVAYIEPGFNVGVMKKPAYANFEYIFFETANPSNIVVKLSQKNVPGSQYGGFDFDASARISESFAKGAKMLSALMGKQLK
ncbi:MAG TPA: hypothetical protein VK766_03160, partial [Cytophagaceae bacterium]|jgi:hypothetical protein|nr:hypothetical protein [Cytophagaceae bacterium]